MKNILIVPCFLADTYSRIEEAYIELAREKRHEINFIWLVRSVDDRLSKFKNEENRKKLREPLYVSHLKTFGLPFITRNISKYNIFANFLLFFNVFREYEIDAVYTHFDFDRYYTAFFGKIFGKITIWNEHMHWNAPGRKFIALKKMFFKIFVDYFISVSTFIASTLPEKSKIYTVVNSVNVEDSGTALSKNDIAKLRKKLLIPPRRKVILMVAAFRPAKRYDLALEICKKVIQARKDILFIFLGDGPVKEAFVKNAAEAGILDFLLMPGHVLNVEEYYKTADLCMLSSINEPCALTTFEALKFSLPLVAFDSGGNSEIVSNGFSGILVPPENTDIFAGKIIELLNSPERRQYLGRNAFEEVRSKFSRSSWIEKMNGVFHKILKDEPVNEVKYAKI